MDQLGWVLVHFLWQGAVIGIVTWVALIILKKFSAQVRYVFLCFSLLFCGLLPCATWVFLDQGSQAHVESAVVPDFSSVKPPLPAVPLAKPSLASDLASYSVGQRTSSRSWSPEATSRIIQAALPYLVALWGLGVSALSLRLAYGWTQLQKFCSSGVPLKDQVWTERLTALANRMGLHLTILILESALVEVPTVIGWLRPVILVPATFFTGLPSDQIEAILAHELAHIRRYDYLVNLVQIAIETVLFYHPVVWWISRAIRQEREHCCDDLALQIVGDKIAYATALAALEESRSLPMAITIAATGGSLVERIRRLLGEHKVKTRPKSIRPALLLFVLCVLVSMISWWTYRHMTHPVQVASDKGASTAAEGEKQSNPQIKALRQAVIKTDLPSARHLFDQGLKLAPDGDESATLLGLAARMGNLEMIKLLLDHGIDINAKSKEGQNALYWAVGNKQDEASRFLIDHNIDINNADQYGHTAAWDAAFAAKLPATLELLRQKGAKFNGDDKNGATIFTWMMHFVPPQSGKVGFLDKSMSPDELKKFHTAERQTIETLVAGGADPNGMDSWLHETPLISALAESHHEMARALLDAGADVQKTDDKGNSPLVYLGLKVWSVPVPLDVLKRLLAEGADANSRTKAKDEMELIPNKSTSVLELLIERAESNAADADDHSAQEAIKLLLDRGATFSGTLKSSESNLLRAAALGDLTDLKAAVGQGASIDFADADGWTALTVALALGNEDRAQWLIKKGAKVNTKTIDGYSPLWFAAIRQQEQRVNDFLAKGADPNSGLGGYLSALSVTAGNQNLPIFRALMKAGATGSPEAIFAGIQKGNVEMVKLLLEKGTHPDEDNPFEHRGSVYWAVYYNRPEILKLLLDHGADPAMKTDYNETPLSEAQSSHPEMAPILEEAIKRNSENGSRIKNAGGNPRPDATTNLKEKGENAPRLNFVMNGKAVDLSPQAQAKIIGQMEAIIRSIDVTSDQDPGKFKGAYTELSPKVLKENGSYFQVTYPQEHTFLTAAGPIKAKDFYIGIVTYANVPGVPGGLFLVGADNHIINISCHGNLMDETADIALDSEVYPHLPENMRRSVGEGFFDFLDRAKEEDLSPELKLARAVKTGDLSEVRRLLTAGGDVHEILPGQPTLLFAAGSPEMVNFLVQQGIKVDARNERGGTALWSICYNNAGHRPQEAIAPIAQMLLKHGADPNAYNNNAYYMEWSPLMVARDGATVDALVEYGADVHAKVNGHGVLDELDVGYRELPYYQALAAHGLAIDNHENGIHLLNHAAYGGQMDVVNWLLNRGVDPNGIDPISGSYDSFARKPLTEAAREDQAAVAQVLIEHGAKVDDDAVNCALRYGRTRILKVFRDAGAKQFSELYYAVKQNASIEKMTALLQQGIQADPPQDKYVSPLAAAAGQGNLPVVQLLVEHGADPNRKLEKSPGERQFDFAEWTPLAMAAGNGREDIARYLLQNGAHPDADTLKLALYCFYHRGHGAPSDDAYHGIIQLLVDAGACKKVPREQTADLLLWRGDGAGDWCDLPMLKILLAAGLDPTAKNAGGMNAIDLIQARYNKITDAQTRDHLSKEIDLLKNAKAETDTYKEDKTMIVHVQDSDGSPLAGASAKVEGPNISADMTTGTDGLAAISLLTARPQYLSVRVRKDGFVPKLVTWNLDQPSFSLPSDFTLKMEKAQAIGGMVKNDDGQPVAGANVVLIIRGSSMGGMAQQVFNDIWERRVTTDKDGKWHFDEAPSDLRSLSVTLEHPDYISNERIDARPSDDDFKQLKALLIAHKGVSVEGTVTDDKGKPVTGVDVVFGEAGSGSTTSPNTTTDAAGHFHFGGLSIKRTYMLPPILTFTSANYSPEMIELKPLAGRQTLQIQLKPGKRLRLRLTDQQGHPIKNVTLVADHWRGHRPFTDIRFQSDNDGLITWDHAPDDPITYVMLTDSYQNQNLILQPKDEIQSIQLKRQTIVTGRVLDATTSQPITAYDLIFGTYFPPEHPGWSGWARGAALHIQGESYRYVFSDPARMDSADGVEPGTEGFHRIRIEAPGYEPGVSRPIANDEESVSIDFQLKPAPVIHGVVTAVDGTPVNDAQVVIAGPGNPLQIINGVCRSKWDQLTVNTNAQGEYDLPPQEEDYPIAIIQPDAGYFTTTYRALKTSPKVKLLPWGSIALATTAQNDANPPYYVRYVHKNEASYQKERIHFEVYKPSELNNGVAIYKQLVAGPIKIGKFMQDINEGQVVQIENAKTTRVDLRAGKNAIVGKIAMPPGASADSPLTILRLRPVVPDPPYPPNLTQDERRAWVQNWITTPEGKTYQAKAGEIPFTLDAGGNFRIDDVSPGSYQLIAVFLRSLPTGPQAKADVLGAVQRKFELSNAAGDCDLGILPVQTDVH
jgi:ankyrin repeat protein/beta-lactamase regulating signal transducer with metallopeptidase domain